VTSAKITLRLPINGDLPSADEVAAFRAWIEGLGSRQAVDRYLPDRRKSGASSRALIGAIRRQLIMAGQVRQRPDLAAILSAAPRSRQASAVSGAIDALRKARAPTPVVTDEVKRWLPERLASPLMAVGLRTLSAVIVRVMSSRGWWKVIPNLGRIGALKVEAFFAEHPHLTERAAAVMLQPASTLVPFEVMTPPKDLDGSRGKFRAPKATCALAANNDYEAVQAWLALHESGTTRRAYRKEAERLLLWAIVQQGKALSSLMTEDAVAYRAFLRRPHPHTRWIGPVRPRSSHDWRPFQKALSPRSVAYALTVVGALFRWLVEQHYLLANPFAGLKVKGAGRSGALDAERAFTEQEWRLIRDWADKAEPQFGWSESAAQRLRFTLDFAYATGLRSSELVGATLKKIQWDAQGDAWISIVGKGSKAGLVALPPLATAALDRYLVERGLPITRTRWNPKTRLVPSLDEDGDGITASRLWKVLKGFFAQVAASLEDHNPALVEKLQSASPHWMRHTHATHALANGVELTTVRDNLRHASVSTTSIYLHTDQRKRAKQMGEAFARHNV
jgi:site-specific recombinase XerD